MINEEILGGLKSALERGSSLESAMRTFYNSGYKKEEIEEAARGLLEFKPETQIQPPIKTIPNTSKIEPAVQVLAIPSIAKSFPELQHSKIKDQIIPQPPQTSSQKSMLSQESIQKVSDYEGVSAREKTKKPEKNGKRKVIVVLTFLLIVLFAILGIIFVFRQRLIDFLSSLFG